MPANGLPSNRRHEVWLRDSGRCQRCGNEGTDIHHRMRRRDGGHATWNLVLLCRTDHAYVHAHPEEAREQGFIISAHLDHEVARLVPLTNYRGTSRVLT